MDAILSLHDDERADEDIQELVFSLTRTLNQETDLTAGLPEETGGLGTKGDIGIVGQIILAALSSGTVVALLQVLKSYVERKPTLRIEIENADGSKVKIEAEHLKTDRIEQTTRAVQQLCEHSRDTDNGGNG
ncbi:effector-associated constant component EACC1 [Candidatus Electrothrix sp.]|uniref:effector-associated constant component EACC1 n=1 Tax=Candidatus Electrothrix sp. TaxID=2170559 RepID=UPI004057A8D5